MSDQQRPQYGQAIAPPARDLSGAFARKGSPAARKSAAAPKPVASQSPSPESEVTTAAAPEPVARRSAKVSSAADATLRVGRNVFLSNALYDAVQHAKISSKRTRTQVLLDAVKATHTQLSELVAVDLQPKVLAGDLWDEVVEPATQPKRPLRVDLTRQQLDVIDRLVEQTGARDRSQMLSVALKAYLEVEEP